MKKAFLGVFAVIALVSAQDQSGFISLDCGIAKDLSYTDKITSINYISDAPFIDAGVNGKISSEYSVDTLDRQFLNVRSFPEGELNSYTLKPGGGNTKFLIRARFMYGNYDGQGVTPRFNLFLESDVWDSVEFENVSSIVTKEIIHIPQKSYIYVCLVNTGFGAPFISTLELRPLKTSTYQTQSGSLVLSVRWDAAGSTSDETIRYQDDVYDRIWSPWTSSNWTSISSMATFMQDDYQLPLKVMRSAFMAASAGNSLEFFWESSETKLFYFFMHFAEVQVNQTNQTREMIIYVNGELLFASFILDSVATRTKRSTSPTSGKRIDFSIKKTEDSTLPPIINALEIHWVKNFSQLLTNQQDVDAIMDIKTKYGVKKNWQGDPCVPKFYSWQGLNCSYDGPPRIISLNLSSNGLAGGIAPSIRSLTSIQSLDLSNNNLVGPVPAFLSELKFLTVLNLTGNNLKGSVPAGLKEKAEDGLLSLSVGGNPKLCYPASCKDKHKLIAPVVASVVSVSALSIAVAILWRLKKRKQVDKSKGPVELKAARVSYSNVVRITNNFERVIGKGGFGTVYHGCLEDTQVAVKMLSPSAVHGHKQFQTEVEHLIRVHHKNLIALVGYCEEGTHLGLIYEFMANGNLEAHLLGCTAKDENILKWEERLRIATEAAQGLEYLHNGCKPPILHRDVKSTNILLNEKFQAKLADFGLSRIFPVESGSHVSTSIAGTPGYLDPEYYISNRLTEKSDVYSFGVVLLEIITSKPVFKKIYERTHLSQWVSSMLAKGDIKSIVDPRLQGDFNINSAWKAVEIAMARVSPTSSKRPTMSQVVMELNESLAIEIARTSVGSDIELRESIELMNLNLHAELSPQAR